MPACLTADGVLSRCAGAIRHRHHEDLVDADRDGLRVSASVSVGAIVLHVVAVGALSRLLSASV